MGAGILRKSRRVTFIPENEQRRQCVALSSEVVSTGKPEGLGPESHLPSSYRNKAKCYWFKKILTPYLFWTFLGTHIMEPAERNAQLNLSSS
jgi:hypothetical protein